MVYLKFRQARSFHLSSASYGLAIVTIFLLSINCTLSAQNYSLSFDGTDDEVEIISSPELTQNNFSIEAWVKPSNSATIKPIFTKYNTNIGEISYSLSILSDNRIRFVVYESFRSVSDLDLRGIDTNNPVINANTWQHVAATFDTTTQDIKIYLNGAEIESTLLNGSTEISTIYRGTQPVHIGSSVILSGNAFFFDGEIDEVRFWDYSRTIDQINSDKDTELSGTEDGLVAYYKFDNSELSCDIVDCNKNANHGMRMGVNGTNNLPQYSSESAELVDEECQATDGCALVSVTNDNSETPGISVYPNPANSSLFVKSAYQPIIGASMTITSMNGMQVFSQIINNSMETINLAQIPKGMYLVRIKFDNTYTVKKIIIN